MTDTEIHSLLSVAARHHAAGRFAEAEPAYRRILAERPKQFDALQLLGTLCAQTGRREEGIELMTRACAINPDVAVLQDNLGVALRASGHVDRAIAAFEHALRLDPQSAGAYNNLGVALRLSDRPHEAVAMHRKALELQPNLADAWTNLAVAMSDTGQHAEALPLAEKAVRLEPSHPVARLNLSILQLQHGDYQHGWAGYESRWECADMVTPRSFTEPAWTGEMLHGRTILVHAEQGIGDTIQFVQFMPRIAARGGRIVFECRKSLHRLLRDFPGIADLRATGDPLPPFDVHCPLLSVPHRLGLTDATSDSVPYLKADPNLLKKWEERAAMAAGQRLKIGLAWAGHPKHANDRQRSMRLGQFAELASDDVAFFALTKRSVVPAVGPPPAGFRFVDFSDHWDDFSDTAALIANMDLVISVDTSAAHLAGAMNRPVWTLLALNPDWRWQLNRENTGWYPSMRLFRQRTIGGWKDVVARVRVALDDLRRR